MGDELTISVPCEVRTKGADRCGQSASTDFRTPPLLPLRGRGGADGLGGGGIEGAEVGCLLAIDIGASGALALLTPSGELLDIVDMPTIADGPAYRPGINGALLASIVRRWAPASAVVEHVAARPREAPTGAFSFGRSRGVIEGVLGAQAVPVRFVTPAWWKRRVGIPPGAGLKDVARSKAIARWPHHAELFARVMDHDRAEAALIGFATILEERQVA